MAPGQAQANEATRTQRIALVGPFSSRNLGDTATQLTVIRQLRQRLPYAQIIGVSPEPQDSLNSLGIAAFPLTGRGPTAGDVGAFNDLARAASVEAKKRRTSPAAALRIDRFVGTLDLLIFSGGGQLDDHWGGAWGHPWSMLLWAALARRRNVRVVFLGIGLDRLQSALSRHFALWALRLGHQRLFRDPYSLNALRTLGLQQPCDLCPDLAFSLIDGPEPRPVNSAPFAVLSPISRSTWSHTHDARHDDYLRKLCAVGVALTAHGLALRIVCSQDTMDGRDAQTLGKLLDDAGVSNVTLCVTPTVRDFLAQVEGAQIAIAARLHSVILCLVAGVPVIALSHLPKVTQAMSQAGLADYCLPLTDFTVKELTARAESALQRAPELRRHVSAVTASFRQQLAGTFDALVSLV